MKDQLPLEGVSEETMEEALALIAGEDLASYRAKRAESARLYAIARLYVGKPKKCWPQISFNWDLRQESMRFALDGMSQESFEKQFPDQLLLGMVPQKLFHKKLCRFSRRDGARELWKVGCKSKLARCIAYLSEGHPITPPLVKPVENDEILLLGGHHRYAIANALHIHTLPIYVEPQHVDAISKIIDIEWRPAAPHLHVMPHHDHARR